MTVRVRLVLDCSDPEAVAASWPPALGYTNVVSAGRQVVLLPAEGDGRQLLRRGVVVANAAKNWMHLDLHVSDVGVEVDCLAALGERRLETDSLEEHDPDWFL